MLMKRIFIFCSSTQIADNYTNAAVCRSVCMLCNIRKNGVLFAAIIFALIVRTGSNDHCASLHVAVIRLVLLASVLASGVDAN